MLLKLYRVAHRLHVAGVPWLPRLIYVFNRIVFAAVIPPSAKIGSGVVLGYQDLGIVIHKRAVIGNDVVIGPGVAVGGRGAHVEVPVIGDGVVIGAGAKVIGPVRVGDGARIGANAVVLCDVPPGATAVGVPARVLSPGGAAADVG